MFIGKLKIRDRLALLVGILVVGFTVLVLFGLGTINKVKVGSRLYAQVKNYHSLIEKIHHLKVDLSGIRALAASTGFVTDGDTHKKIKSLTKEVDEGFNEVIEHFGREVAIKTALTSARLTWKEFSHTMENRYLPALLSKDKIKALKVSEGVQKRRYDRFAEQIDSAENTAGLRVEEIEENVSGIVRNSVLLFIIGSIVMISAVMLFALIISWSITKPLRYLNSFVEALNKGDLSERIDVKTGGEIGLLAASFNKMTEDLSSSRAAFTKGKEFTENIIKSMADTLIVVSPDAMIEKVNQATLDLLRYEEDELIGKLIGLIFEEEEEEEVLFKETGIVDLIEKSSVTNIEKTFLSKDGRKIPVLLSGSVMRDEEGAVQGMVCVALDMSERKQSEEKLKKSVVLSS